MDYQSRFNAIRGDMADEASLLAWQADKDFQEWLRNGPIVIDRHTVTRTGHKRCTVIEPDGTVFTDILFGPTVADDLAAMLAHHRKGKPREERRVTDRERIEILERRVDALEALLSNSITFPEDVADLIDWQAPPKERQEALLVKLREVQGLIGLAEDRGGRAEPSLYTRRDRIESGIRYNRASSAEAI
jgi:hypothetical protein